MRLNRRHAITVVLTGSLLMNVAAVVFAATRVASKGGVRYLLERLHLQDVKPTPPKPFQAKLRQRYERLPNIEGEIDFVGDSLIGDGPWSEFFSPIKNRGIGGDTTGSLYERLGEVT